MNYSKKSTSRKQKALKGKGTKMGKKLGVVFMKTLLVLIIALGVAGLCGGIGIIKGVMENAPDITSASVLPRGYKSVVYDADGNKTAELVAEGTNRSCGSQICSQRIQNYTGCKYDHPAAAEE